MPTLKRRINVTLPQEVERVLTRLAERDHVPQATKAVELLQRAMEIEEDQVWDALARRRDTTKARFVSHKEAWW